MNQIHIDLLLDLRAHGQYGAKPADLLTDMRGGRHRELTQPDLDKALRDLADRSLATPYETVLKAKRWRITALGESALKEDGL